MFSWLVIVTFVVSILFYAMFPRTDGFKTIDKPWSNYYGDILVHQHLAAWKASTVKSLATGQEAYNHAVRTGSSGLYAQTGNIYYIKDSFDYIRDFLRPGEIGEVYKFGPDAEIKSVIFCVDNETNKFLNTCAVDFGKTEAQRGTSDYLVTFTALPSTESYLAIRQLGEKMFLMNYNAENPKNTKKTTANMRVQCGALIPHGGAKGDFQPGSSYVLDNTRHSNVGVPVVIARWLKEQERGGDTIMCITRLFATYDTSETPAKLVYPSFQK